MRSIRLRIARFDLELALSARNAHGSQRQPPPELHKRPDRLALHPRRYCGTLFHCRGQFCHGNGNSFEPMLGSGRILQPTMTTVTRQQSACYGSTRARSGRAESQVRSGFRFVRIFASEPARASHQQLSNWRPHMRIMGTPAATVLAAIISVAAMGLSPTVARSAPSTSETIDSDITKIDKTNSPGI